ncbi:MAG: hypothetical protein SWH68_04490 [Thermodesulfobacteriota bacterium]|nr:hypothetical protein [Thermodesulfobacteriota bacterium]
MTQENDIVLIYFEDEPMIFARVEHITADHKKDWFQVTLLVLGLPLKTVTWILREEYINGAEFTMDGKKMRMEKVVSPVPSEKSEDKESSSDTPRKDGRDTAAGGRGDSGDARVITFPGLPGEKGKPRDDGA